MGDHPGVDEDFFPYLDRIDEALRERMAYIEEQIRHQATVAAEKLLEFDENLHDREQELLHYGAMRRQQ